MNRPSLTATEREILSSAAVLERDGKTITLTAIAQERGLRPEVVAEAVAHLATMGLMTRANRVDNDEREITASGIAHAATLTEEGL